MRHLNLIGRRRNESTVSAKTTHTNGPEDSESPSFITIERMAMVESGAAGPSDQNQELGKFSAPEAKPVSNASPAPAALAEAAMELETCGNDLVEKAESEASAETAAVMPKAEEMGDDKDMELPTSDQLEQSASAVEKDADVAKTDQLEPAPELPLSKQPLYAWLVLFAAFMCSMCGWGLIFAGGIWQRFFFVQGTFGDSTQAQLAWVGSIAYASCTVLGVIVGRVSDLFGHQRVLAFGTTLFILSMICSSFATQLWQLYITQGLMYGLAVACLYIPASGVLVTHWTGTKRAFAISITGMGSGIGGFIWPQIVQACLDSLGMAWAYRIIGIAGGVTLICCTLILKPKDAAARKGMKRGPFFDTSFFKSKHYWLLSLVGFFVTFGYYVSRSKSRALLMFADFVDLRRSQLTISPSTQPTSGCPQTLAPYLSASSTAPRSSSELSRRLSPASQEHRRALPRRFSLARCASFLSGRLRIILRGSSALRCFMGFLRLEGTLDFTRLWLWLRSRSSTHLHLA